MSISFEPEEVEFILEKEGWNVYELSDGTTLKLRPVVLKVFKAKLAPPAKGRGFGIASQSIVVARARPDHKGTPREQPFSPEELEKAPKTDISFTEKEELWNSYLLPDGVRLKLKLVVTSIKRAEGLYEQFGNPVYVTTSDNVMNTETMKAPVNP